MDDVAVRQAIHAQRQPQELCGLSGGCRCRIGSCLRRSQRLGIQAHLHVTLLRRAC
jgi:hypothetical protein